MASFIEVVLLTQCKYFPYSNAGKESNAFGWNWSTTKYAVQKENPHHIQYKMCIYVILRTFYHLSKRQNGAN